MFFHSRFGSEQAGWIRPFSGSDAVSPSYPSEPVETAWALGPLLRHIQWVESWLSWLSIWWTLEFDGAYLPDSMVSSMESDSMVNNPNINMSDLPDCVTLRYQETVLAFACHTSISWGNEKSIIRQFNMLLRHVVIFSIFSSVSDFSHSSEQCVWKAPRNQTLWALGQGVSFESIKPCSRCSGSSGRAEKAGRSLIKLVGEVWDSREDSDNPQSIG